MGAGNKAFMDLNSLRNYVDETILPGVESFLMTELAAVTAAISDINNAVNAIDSRLDAIDIAIPAIEARLDAIDIAIPAIEARLDAIDSTISIINGRLFGFDMYIVSNDTNISALDARITALENP